MDMQKTIKSLTKAGYKVSHFKTAQEATAYLATEIHGKTVGFGGSKTLEAMGLYEALSNNNSVYWHWKTGEEALKQSQNAQIYFSSVNGIAETGELINIDGTGNRLSATLWGHEKLYLVAGSNKIAPDFHSALARARNIAGVLNARRLGVDTPCVRDNGDDGSTQCFDCKSPHRICRGLTVLWRPMKGFKETEVVLIDEELGY